MPTEKEVYLLINMEPNTVQYLLSIYEHMLTGEAGEYWFDIPGDMSIFERDRVIVFLLNRSIFNQVLIGSNAEEALVLNSKNYNNILISNQFWESARLGLSAPGKGINGN